MRYITQNKVSFSADAHSQNYVHFSIMLISSSSRSCFRHLTSHPANRQFPPVEKNRMWH